MFPGLGLETKNKSITIEVVDNGFILKIHSPKNVNPFEAMAKGMKKGMDEVDEPWKEFMEPAPQEKEFKTIVCKSETEVLGEVQIFLEHE